MLAFLAQDSILLFKQSIGLLECLYLRGTLFQLLLVLFAVVWCWCEPFLLFYQGIQFNIVLLQKFNLVFKQFILCTKG